jgi:ribosomal protein S18 acetylase RimI-like enzyme
VSATGVERVRDATEEDVPALVEMIAAEAREAEGRALDPAVVTAAVTAALRDPTLARTWLLCDGDERVGAIAALREWSDWRNAAYWWIQFVYLVPAARGRGLLAALVDRVVAEARSAGAPELRLYVHRENQRAIRAYQRVGFETRPHLIMAQELAAAPGAAPELDDGALWTAFHARTLSHTAWNHAAHLRTAWLHLERYGLDESHLRMRAGILRLNASHGLVESPARGYHETLTRVWLVLVAEARAHARCDGSIAFLAAHPLGRDAPLRFYSRERLFSLEARATFIPPDRAPLPDVG